MKPKLVLTVVLVLVAAGTIWFLSTDESGPSTLEPGRDALAADAERTGIGSLAEDLATSATTGDRTALESAALGSKAPGDDTAEATAVAWIEGRVAHPPGLPANERAIVYASTAPKRLRDLSGPSGLGTRVHEGTEVEHPELLGRTEMASDGSFRLPLSRASDRVHLAVSGRYLYSRATTSVDPLSSEPVVVAAELGAWIDGRVKGPGANGARAVELTLRPDVMSGLDVTQYQALGERRVAHSDASGSFEFRGVPAVGAFELTATATDLAAHHRSGLALKPGERLALELALASGATLLGRVVDESNAPVANAQVTAHWRGARGEAIEELRRTTSDDEGRFELAHVADGRVEVRASAEGLLETRQQVGQELLDGARHEGLVLVLGRGAALAGRVVFEGGAPAAGANVVAGVDITQMGAAGATDFASLRGGNATADDSGRFELVGLSASVFRVTAEVHVEDGIHAGTWRASRTGVAHDAPLLELTLERLGTMRGRVVSLASGEPLTSFTVDATLSGSGSMFGIGSTRRTQVEEAAVDGLFEFDDLERGTWNVKVAAPGHAASETRAITVSTAGGEELQLFALELGSTISGRVVDPVGRPAAGARVALELDMVATMAARQGGNEVDVIADANGLFEIVDLAQGAHVLRASAEGFASSEPTTIEVALGATTGDVVLELRRGGALEGQVFGDSGEPLPDQVVVAQPMSNPMAPSLSKTDGDGAFRFEHLEPGSWQVVAVPDQREMEAAANTAEAQAAALDQLKIAMVDIVDGEVTTVVLGQAALEAVELTVRVTHADEPLAGALVTLLRKGTRGKDVVSGLKLKMSDKEGQLVVRLDGPGDYLATVQVFGAGGEQNSVESTVRVPSGVSAHTLDLEMPGGRIAGRVRNAQGAPIARCRISVGVDDGLAYGSVVGGSFVETTTDAEGRYEVLYLRAGTYSVGAGGMMFGGMVGGPSAGGRVVKNGIALTDGQRLDGVDFELEAAVTLSGVVRDSSGAPVSGAGVFVRAVGGELVDRLSGVTSDASGRFEYAGLAVGEYVVSARKGALVSDESARVFVDGDRRGDVALVLRPGTMLLVQVVDDNDEVLDARLSVFDARGGRVSGMLALGEVMEVLEAGLSSTEQRVGPLAPGNYTVAVALADGRTKSHSVSVAFAGEQTVRIALD